MRAVLAKAHRDLAATQFWSYGGSVPGPTIEARRGEAVLVEWPNELPAKHMFAIDHNLMGAEADKPEVRTVVHLHGAKVPPQSDGYPENWYTAGRSATYHYPNEQDATMLWYHDHAMGINRLNVLAGLFGLYIVRDAEEDALDLPRGKYEVPLVLFDRMFTPDGQLYYPVSGVEGAPWIPEFFGDAILVNGKILPYLEVEARPYRFRVANVSNGRFYNLSLTNGDDFHQIANRSRLLLFCRNFLSEHSYPELFHVFVTLRTSKVRRRHRMLEACGRADFIWSGPELRHGASRRAYRCIAIRCIRASR
jgi:spore coat protein A